MTSPLPPGMRRIDPDAEAARLAEARKRASGPWHVILGEICGGPGVDTICVQVSATRPVRLPDGIGAKLVAVVRENWPASDD